MYVAQVWSKVLDNGMTNTTNWPCQTSHASNQAGYIASCGLAATEWKCKTVINIFRKNEQLGPAGTKTDLPHKTLEQSNTIKCNRTLSEFI